MPLGFDPAKCCQIVPCSAPWAFDWRAGTRQGRCTLAGWCERERALSQGRAAAPRPDSLSPNQALAR